MTDSEQEQAPLGSLEAWDVRTRVVLRKDYDPRQRHFIPGAKYRPLQNTFFMGRLDVPRDEQSCRLLRRFEPLATDDQGHLMHLSHATEKQVTEAGEIEKITLKEGIILPNITQCMQAKDDKEKEATGLWLVHVPVQDVLSMMLASGREDWKPALHKILDKPDFDQHVPFLPLQNIEVDEVDWAAFPKRTDGFGLDRYHHLDGRISAIVMPYFRTVYVTFTDPAVNEGRVQLTSLNSGKEFYGNIVTAGDGLFAAAVGGSDRDFEPGIYRMQVFLPDGGKIKKVLGKPATNGSVDDTGWSMLVHLDFPIETPFGPAQVAQGDPVTVEETLMQQFPDAWQTQWSGRLQALNAETFNPAIASPLMRATLAAGAGVKWASGTLTRTSQRDIYWDIAGALRESAFIQANRALRDVVDMVFTAREIRQAINADAVEKLREGLRDINQLRANGRLALAGAKATLSEKFWAKLGFNWKAALEDEDKTPFYLSTLDIDSRLKGPLDKTLRAARLAGAALGAYDLYDSIMGVPKAWSEVGAAQDKADSAYEFFGALAQNYLHRASVPAEGAAHGTPGGEPERGLLDDTLPETPFWESLGLTRQIAREVIRLDFKNNETRLPDPMVERFKALAEQIRDRLQAGAKIRVHIAGHASSPGSYSWNLLLSEKRALFVRKELVRRLRSSEADPDVYADQLQITVSWHGETQLVIGQNGKEDEAASRRVELEVHEVLENVAPRWLPCREAQKALALRCDRAVAASMELDKAWQAAMLATLSAMYDTVEAVLSVVPGFQTIAGAMVVAKSAVTAASGALDQYQEIRACGGLAEFGLALVEGDLGVLRRVNRQLIKVRDRARHNEVLMLERASEYADTLDDNNADPEARLQAWSALQFHLRYQVLNGLLGLIQRATWLAVKAGGDPQAGLRRCFEQLDIEGYIETYLLQDGWGFDTRQQLPVALDALWLQEHGPGASGALNAQLEAALPNGMASLSHGLWYHYRQLASLGSSFWKDHVIARTQTLFPVHGQLSHDSDALLTHLATEDFSIVPESLAFSELYWTLRGQNTGWKTFRSRFNFASQTEPLSPYEPVRIIVVLEEWEVWSSDEEGEPGKDYVEDPRTGKRYRLNAQGEKIPFQPPAVPVTLWLHRFDGVNVSCPLMHINLHALQSHELLDHEQRYAGRIGAVIYPFFQYGPLLHHGLRPLASDSWWDIAVDAVKSVFRSNRSDCSWRYGALSKMECALSLRVGADEQDIYLRWTDREIDYDATTASADDLFALNVDPERAHTLKGKVVRDEYLLTDTAFLTHNTVVYPQPRLFEGNVQVQLFFRFGDGPWLHPDPDWNTGRTLRKPATEIMTPEIALEDGLLKHLFVNKAEAEWAKTAAISSMPEPDKPDFRDDLRIHALTLDESAWDTPTELMVVVTCDELGDAYTGKGGRKHPLPLHPVGVQLQSQSFEASLDGETLDLDDVANGPLLSTAITHQGLFDSEAADVKATDSGGSKPTSPAKTGQWLQSLLDSAPKEKEARKKALTQLLGAGTRHVFAGTLKLNYQGPTGRVFNGLRPFGELYDEDSFQRTQTFAALGFGRIVSAGDSGLDVEGWTRPGSDLRCLLLMELPESLPNSPWMQLPADVNTNDLAQKLAENASQSLPARTGQTIAKHAWTPELRWAEVPENERPRRLWQWMTGPEQAARLKQDAPDVFAGQ